MNIDFFLFLNFIQSIIIAILYKKHYVIYRSKGRIASGLLHAKAGILRAGANILAQKANALDKVAQAIPAAKAGLINQIQGVGGGLSLPGIGGGGGYGAPQNTGEI